MQKFNEKIRTSGKKLTKILLILLCFLLPGQVLYWTLCTKQDRNIPPNTEVLVSACKKPVVRGVPGGEVLFVHETLTGKTYLLDLRTGEKRTVPNDPLLLNHGIFLNSKLAWLEGSSSRPESSYYRPDYILDLTDGKRYELIDLTWVPLKDGKFDPKNYKYFQDAQNIYIHHAKNKLIALPLDFSKYPEEDVIFSQSSLGSIGGVKDGELLEKLMKDLDLNYEVVDFSLRYVDVLSPTGKYIIRNDGIYLLASDIPIVDRQFGGCYNVGYFRSWYYDESAVVVQGDSDYLITTILGAQFFLIPSPVLKLSLPVQ